MRPQFFKLLVACLMLMMIPLSGCGYPEVSPKTYEISKALYSVCNQKSQERLEIVTKLIQSSLENKEINASEADWLNGIIAQAREGDWQSAMQESRQMLEDQADR